MADKYIDKESSVRAHAEKLVDLEFVVVDVVCDSLIVFHPYSALEVTKNLFAVFKQSHAA